MSTATASARPSDSTFATLLRGPDTTLAVLRDHLASLDGPERIRQCRELGGRQLARLYDVAGDGEPVGPDHMVRGVDHGQTVRWYGKNSLPVFTHFEKRFARHADGTVIGFNFQTMAAFTGPGYFSCRVDDIKPRELLIDYTMVPASGPTEWPAIKPNERGLSRFVYAGMYDYCRKVSDEVVIGAATKKGKMLGAYFVLCSG